MVLIVAPMHVGATQKVAGKLGIKSYIIGEIQRGRRKVQIV